MKFKFEKKNSLLAVFITILLAGCSPYDNFTTLFNTYYNENRLMKESEDEFEYQEEKKRVTPRVFVPEPKIFIPAVPKTGTPPFMTEFIVEQQKLQPVKIKLDSIIIKGSKILAYHPGSGYVEGSLFLMAKAYFYRSEWMPSEIKCGELIDKYPAGDYSPDAHLLWSENLLIQRKFYAGKIMLSRTVDIAWQKKRYDILSEAFRLQADLALYENDHQGAITPYKRAIAQSDDFLMKAKWQVDMSAILYRLGKFPEAEKSFAKVHTYSPDYQAEFEAYLYQALCLIRMGKYEEGENILNNLEKDGKYEEWKGYVFAARMTELRLQKKEKELAKAEKFADSAYSNNQGVMVCYFERGMDFFNEKDYVTSRMYFSRTRNQRTPVYQTSDRMFNLLNSWDQKLKVLNNYYKDLKDTSSTKSTKPDSSASIMLKKDSVADSKSKKVAKSNLLTNKKPDTTNKTNVVPDNLLTQKPKSDSAIVNDTKQSQLKVQKRKQKSSIAQKGKDDSLKPPKVKADSSKSDKVIASNQNKPDSIKPDTNKVQQKTLKDSTITFKNNKDSSNNQKVDLGTVQYLSKKQDSLTGQTNVLKPKFTTNSLIDSLASKSPKNINNPGQQRKDSLPQISRYKGFKGGTGSRRDSIAALNANRDANSIKKLKDSARAQTRTALQTPPPKPPVLKGDTLKIVIAMTLFELGRVHEELGNKDSTINYYKSAIDMSPKWDKGTARYLYAYSRVIRDTDPKAADSLLEVIVDRYPLTEYGREAMKVQGYTDNFVIDTVADLYKSGNSLRLIKEYTYSISQFLKIFDNYPVSPFAPRALYAIGWIYEKNIKNLDSALLYYQKLIDKYPDSEYAKDVLLSVNIMNLSKSGKPLPDSLKQRTQQRAQAPNQPVDPQTLQQIQSQDPNKQNQLQDPNKQNLKPGQVDMNMMDALKDPNKALKNAMDAFKNPELIKPDVNLPINPMNLFKSDKDKAKDTIDTTKKKVPEPKATEPKVKEKK